MGQMSYQKVKIASAKVLLWKSPGNIFSCNMSIQAPTFASSMIRPPVAKKLTWD